MADKEVVYKFPKGLGACADKLYQLKQKRLDAQKIVDAIAAEESAYKAHIIDNLPKSDASGIAGKLARVTVITKDVPQVTDWDAFYKYIVKTKDFSLLQRRVGDAAIKERWENKKEVPGVGHFNAVTISMNKV